MRRSDLRDMKGFDFICVVEESLDFGGLHQLQLWLRNNAGLNKLGEKKMPLENTSNLKISVLFFFLLILSYFVTSVRYYYKSIIPFLQCDNLYVS